MQRGGTTGARQEKLQIVAILPTKAVTGLPGKVIARESDIDEGGLEKSRRESTPINGPQSLSTDSDLAGGRA